MCATRNSRRQWFVDPDVQGALVWRAILYWCTCLGTMMLMLLCWRLVTGPSRLFYRHFDDMWFYYGPALIVSTLILPFVVMDIIRLSNRFAGPMVRLRRAMRALARGEHVAPIKFRENDFWQPFAEEFNAVVARVQGDTSAEEADHPQTAETASSEEKEEDSLHTVGSSAD